MYNIKWCCQKQHCCSSFTTESQLSTITSTENVYQLVSIDIVPAYRLVKCKERYPVVEAINFFIKDVWVKRLRATIHKQISATWYMMRRHISMPYSEMATAAGFV